MKVLLVSLFHPEIVRGGAQQVCYELFQGLKERDDVDVTLLAVDGQVAAGALQERRADHRVRRPRRTSSCS